MCGLPLAQTGAGSRHYFLLSRAGIYVASFPCVPSVHFSNASPSPALLWHTSSQRAPLGLVQGLLCFVNSEVESLGYQICVFLVCSRGQIALHLPTPVFLRGSNTLKSTIIVLYPRSDCILVGGIFRTPGLCTAEVGNFCPHLLTPK